jgi:hypothetical protein
MRTLTEVTCARSEISPPTSAGSASACAQGRVVQRVRVRHEIADDELVALGARVLEVGDRVHADGVRRGPADGGEFLHRAQGLAREHAAVTRRDDERHVVGLGVGRLDRIVRQELRIVRLEEDAVAALHPEVAHAVERGRDHGQRREEQRHPPAHEPGGQSRLHCGSSRGSGRGAILAFLLGHSAFRSPAGPVR